jgi:hypothetical protein
MKSPLIILGIEIDDRKERRVSKCVALTLLGKLWESTIETIWVHRIHSTQTSCA